MSAQMAGLLVAQLSLIRTPRKGVGNFVHLTTASIKALLTTRRRIIRIPIRTWLPRADAPAIASAGFSDIRVQDCILQEYTGTSSIDNSDQPCHKLYYNNGVYLKPDSLCRPNEHPIMTYLTSYWDTPECKRTRRVRPSTS